MIFIDEEQESLSDKECWIGRKLWSYKGDVLDSLPRGTNPGEVSVIEPVKQVWVQPGFAKPILWAQKSYLEAQKREDALCLMMGLGNHSTDWFRWCYDNCYQILDLSPRPQFIAAPDVTQTSNPHENCLFEFRSMKYIRNHGLLGGKGTPWRWRQ